MSKIYKQFTVFLFLIIGFTPLFAQPTITSFTPSSGPVGTLVTITGTNLSTPTALTIGGINAIEISNTGTSLVAMVMPGTITGVVSVTTADGTANGTGNFTVTSSQVPNAQQGNKLVGTGATAFSEQGGSIAVSADGNTAIVGGRGDNSFVGAAWIYTRSGGVWTQQGAKLVGTGATGAAQQGISVSLSADGNTAIVGGHFDNSQSGAVWIYTRSGGAWSQQGAKLVGTGTTGGGARQGFSVSLSADGNTAVVGGFGDNSSAGAAWVFTRSGGVWSQQGSKLVGTGATGAAKQGNCVSISADGNTAIVSGNADNSNVGAAWVFTRSGVVWSQQGAKLVGTGASGAAQQGSSVAISADGNTAIVGGNADNSNTGAAWVYTRSAGAWTQQVNKLVGTGTVGLAQQGYAVSVSADGNTAIVGGYGDNNGVGAVWVYTRNSELWSQQGSKLIGTGAAAPGLANQGYSVSISADGNIAMVGGYQDNNSTKGAVWTYAYITPPPSISNFSATSGPVGTLVTITGTNLNNPSAITIGGVAAIPISNTGTSLVAMVMPGATTGVVRVTTAGGTVNGTGNFTVTATQAPNTQQGAKLFGTGAVGVAQQGYSIALSADGNTAIVGGYNDNSNAGAAWVYTRSGGIWSQQGNKLVGIGAIGTAFQGNSVAISADGNTAIVGGPFDNSNAGAAWVFTRSGGVWSQQGAKLFGTGAVGVARQGWSVGLSADGNRAIVGGYLDDSQAGAVWMYTRTGTNWTQDGNKLVGTGATGAAGQGFSVSLSADGFTAIVGGYADNSFAGAAWVFNRNGSVWSQQGAKLVGTGAIGNAYQGISVSLNADGNTAIVGGYNDNSSGPVAGNLENSAVGAAWVYTRSSGVWSQQGTKLVGTGTVGVSSQGTSVKLSADGNTAMVGGYNDDSKTGAAWVYTRSGGAWSQRGNKLVGNGSVGSGQQGFSVALSTDGNTAIVGGNIDNSNAGAAWVYTYVPPPTITNFTATSGPVGSLVTITGTNLSNPSAITIGGVSAIPISNTGINLVAMVMPGATTGTVSVTTASGTANGTGNFTVTASLAPNAQQGAKLIGTGGVIAQIGWSLSISADGNTAIVGGANDNSSAGAAWVYSRSGGVWSQQGSKLVGTGATGNASQGFSVSLSADGNTAIVGGPGDNGNVGAAWVYTRSGGVWSQQGSKLVGSGAVGIAYQGRSVSISGDGNTAIVGGWSDNSNVGATWVFVRSSGAWSQQGAKLVGTGATGNASQGISVSLSSDGNTAIIGGSGDNSGLGAAWIYTRSGSIWIQQDNKLVGTDASGNASQGVSVSLSADGNTAIVGGTSDNSSAGAAWVFTRSGGVWSQQGSKLIGTGATGNAQQGRSVSLSANGNTAIVGGSADNNFIGAAWVYTRSGGIWSQQGTKLLGNVAVGSFVRQGWSASLSADGNTAIVGGWTDNSGQGAAWVYTYVPPPLTITNFTATSGPVGSLVTITGTNLSSPTAITIGGVSAIAISNTGTSLVAMVMPGATAGVVSVTTASGTANGMGNFIVTDSQTPNAQQSNKLVGTGVIGAAQQGTSLAVSADGNTAIVGGPEDNSSLGAAWIYTRSGGVWSQQGAKLVGTGATGASRQGFSVSISADGNTAIVGGYSDSSSVGAAWVYTRSGGVWSQQGAKLKGTGAIGAASQGFSVSLSADGNTAIVGGRSDNSSTGAIWVYTRTGGVWSQQGSKLVGTGAVGNAFQGGTVSLSADGNTAIAGGIFDNSSAGAAWVFTRSGGVWSQQGAKLVGTGGSSNAQQGGSVSLSADGNTAMVGGNPDNGSAGAVWVYSRSGGVWSQQGTKLVGTGSTGNARQGRSVSLSADGNIAIVGGYADNGGAGAAWVYTRSGGVWSQKGAKLVGSNVQGTFGYHGWSVSLSADGNTAIIGGYFDNSTAGAAWAYTYVQPPLPTITNFTSTSGPIGILVTITGTNLSNPTAITIGGVAAIPISNTGTSLVAMVMPGATTGIVSVTTGGGTANGTGNFTVTTIQTPNTQQGNKLVGTGGIGSSFAGEGQGQAVAMSADGNTAIVGGRYDNNSVGAAWIYTRNGGLWTQQGNKLVGTGAIGASQQGWSVSMSADGNTALVGGYQDNSGAGAVWAYTRSNGVWSQQGAKLAGTGAIGAANQGNRVSLSADGNTAIVGAPFDNGRFGAAWIFNRTEGVWTQQGNKLVGTGGVDPPFSAFVNGFNQGSSVALSADGNTAAVGGSADNGIGAVWIYTRTIGSWSQQGNKLAATGTVGSSAMGFSVALSANGNTLISGGIGDNSSAGAAWVFTRTGSVWTQQGNKLIGTGTSSTNAQQGQSVNISADGNTAIVSGHSDGRIGSFWVYVRNGSTWTQQGNKFVGAGSTDAAGQPIGIQFGFSSALSADGTTVLIGGSGDNNQTGAAWVYTYSPPPTITSASYNASTGSLEVTGTNLIAMSGSANDIDVTKLTLSGELLGNGTFSLTSNTPNVKITSPTSFSVLLGANDRDSVNQLLNKNGTSSIAGITYNLAAANDWMIASTGNADLTGNSITVSNVASLQTAAITTSGTLSALTTTYGTASSTTSFNVSGLSLTNDLTIAAPSGFEISVNTNSGFSNTLTLTQTNGTVSATTIFVRLASTNLVSASPYSGNIILTSTNATTVNVPTVLSTVTTKALSISGVTANNKIVDGNTNATLSGTPILNGIIAADIANVTFGGTPLATFASSAVGSNIAVSVMGYTINGSAAINYSLTQPTGLSANIISLTTTWLGFNSNWNNASNWNNGIPSITQTAIIPNITTLPIQSGIITIDALIINGSASITNNGTIQLVSNLTNNGTIGGTGSIQLNSSKAQVISGTGKINNLSINNTNGVSVAIGISNVQTITNLLTMVSGTFNTSNNIVLQSTANSSAYVSPIPTGASIIGSITAQAWIRGQRGYRTISHPFNVALPLSQLTDNFAISGSGTGFASGFGYSTSSVYSFDSSINFGGFIPISNSPNTSSSLVWTRNRGISVFVRGKGNEGLAGGYASTNEPTAFAIDATGSINQGSIPDYVLGVSPLFNSSNLVGNPYPSPINIKQLRSNGSVFLSANNGGTGVSNTVYIWNPTKSPGVSGSPNQEERGGYDAYTNDGVTDIIVPMFGAFYVNSRGAGNVIKFDENVKAVSAAPLQVLNTNNKLQLVLDIENSKGKWDDVKIRFDKGAHSMSKDPYDGRKLKNDLLDFYTLSSDKEKLTIDSRSDTMSMEEIIPLGLKTKVDMGDFSIKASIVNLPTGLQVYLRDKLLNKETLLKKEGDVYSFSITADSITRGDNRFELSVKKISFTATVPDELSKADASVGPNPFMSELTIQLNKSAVSATSVTTVRVFGFDGKLVRSITSAPKTDKIKLYSADLAQGVYLIEIRNDQFKQIKRVIKN